MNFLVGNQSFGKSNTSELLGLWGKMDYFYIKMMVKFCNFLLKVLVSGIVEYLLLPYLYNSLPCDLNM